MKKKLITGAFTLIGMCLIGQTVVITPTPGTTTNQGLSAWYRGGNALGGVAGNANVLGFYSGQNSQVWFQTNGYSRMLIDKGGNGVTDGRVAIGNELSSPFVPQARLHLSQFGTNGDMFRSDGKNTVNNKWSMWTGGTAATAVERFRITKLTNTFDVDIDNIETATGVGGETSLQLRQAQFKIVARGKRLALFDELFGAIADDIVFGDGSDVNTTLLSSTGKRMFFHGTNGFMGLGETFSESGLNPNYNLHLNEAAASNVYEQYTNVSTGTSPTDGFFSGINGVGVAELNQQENSDMVFYTNATQRMNVNADGRVTMNATGTPLNLGTAGLAHLTVNAGANEGVFGTRSSGAQPRIYFETVGSTDEFVGHSVPFGLLNNMRSTSGIFWNNINYLTWQSDIHINTRTPPGAIPAVLNGNVLSVTQALGRVGLLNTNPANRLEITSIVTDPSPAGLRFTNLTCASPLVTQCNPAAPVFLSVDNNGDVILVNGAANNGMGAYCPTVNNLTGDYLIPFNNHNIYYSGQGLHGAALTTDAMGLGYTCNASLPAKFSVLQDNSLAGGVGLATESTTGGSFINKDVSSVAFKKFAGIDASSDGVQTPGLTITNIGGSFFASNGLENRAVQGRTGGAPPASGTNYAGHFTTGGPGLNTYGVFARGVGASANNYGVYGESGGSGNGYAIYGSNPNTSCLANQWAGYFDGNVNVTGSGCTGTYALTVNGSAFLSSGTLWSTSDKNFKKNIKKLENITDKINKLTGYTYHFRTDEFPDKKFETTEQIGLIAQELKEVFPQLVTTDEKGFMAVNYQGMVPVLLEAVKEQQKQINELKVMVKNSKVTNPNGTEEKTVNSVSLVDVQSIILDQNVPNPFAEQTTINYTLTKGVQKAQMLFYNAEGKLINSSELKTNAGKGQLNVFASDLSNGIYTYTLVVDGKVIDSKRMVKGE